MSVPEPDALPRVRPMLASPGELPAAAREGRWAFEMKWDGVRAVIYVAAGDVQVRTRNDREVVATYPELRGLGAALGDRRVVLDGEIVAVDDAGRPSFGVLQARMHVLRPRPELLGAVPVSFLAFDALHVHGESLLAATYERRRAVLQDLGLDGSHWATPPAFEGDGESALAVSLQQGLEGVVAKRRASLYLPGRRSRDWLKVKNIRTQDVVVGGWSPGTGNRSGRIGSLLLGVHDGQGRLLYAGHVGTGFSVATLEDLMRRLTALARESAPFGDEVPRAHARDAHWVTPTLVGEVAFSEWTREGRLRHPTWRGLRPDRAPADVVRES